MSAEKFWPGESAKRLLGYLIIGRINELREGVFFDQRRSQTLPAGWNWAAGRDKIKDMSAWKCFCIFLIATIWWEGQRIEQEVPCPTQQCALLTVIATPACEHLPERDDSGADVMQQEGSRPSQVDPAGPVPINLRFSDALELGSEVSIERRAA